MTESIGKKFRQLDSSLASILPSVDSDLNFSKGFKYKDQNLDNVHNSSDEIMDINRTKLESYIGEKIPDKKMSDEEIDAFGEGLTPQQARWINQKLATNEYDTNTLVSYVSHRNEWVNPYADGTGMYEKKINATDDGESSNLWKWTAGILGGAETVGKTRSIIGNYLLKKTVDKYLPEDVSRLIRHSRYEEVPKILSEELKNTEGEIEKAESRLGKAMGKRLVNAGVSDETRQNLEGLYARRDALRESISSMDETKKNLPSNKPETSAQTAKNMKGMYGSDLNAAKNAAIDAQVYYTTEIAPIYKQVKTTFNMEDILNSLTKEDFPGKTEGEFKEIKKLIKEETKAYSKYKNISAEELHNLMSDFDLSKEAIKGEDPKGIVSAFKKAVYTKINNIIDDVIETELPGRGIKNKRLEYNNRLNIAKELEKYAVEGGKRKPEQGIIKDTIDAVKSPGTKRTIGKWLKTSGEFIRPSRYTIKPIINWFKNKTKSQISAAAKTIEEKAPEIAKKAKEEVKTVAKDFKQPKLFGDSINEGAIIMSYLNEKMGIEMPIEMITELVSYALEANKLNKEGRDLPLYDKENSYVNQNPNAGKLESIMNRDNSMYDQDWYKQLQEEENLQDEEYMDIVKNIDIDEMLNSIE